jgi:hypothetical protein
MIVGELDIALVSLTVPQESYGWTTIFPPTDFVPLHRKPIEYFGTTLYGICVALNLGYTLLYVYRVLKSKKGSTLNLTGFVHFFLLIAQTLDFAFWYLVIQSDVLYDWLSAILSWTKNLATFFAVLINAKITCDLLEKRFGNHRTIRRIMYIAVTIVHLSLCLPGYLYHSKWEKSFLTLLKRWGRETGIIWLLGLIGFDAIVGIYTALEMVRLCDNNDKMGWSDVIVKAVQDQLFLTISFGQLTVFGLYWTNHYVNSRTLLYGSEYGLYGGIAISQFLLAVHALLVTHTYNHYSVLVKRVLQNRSKQKQRLEMESRSESRRGATLQ